MKKYTWYILLIIIGLSAIIWFTLLRSEKQDDIAIEIYQGLATLNSPQLPFARLHDSIVFDKSGLYLAFDGFQENDNSFTPYYVIYDIQNQSFSDVKEGDIISRSRDPHLIVSTPEKTQQVIPQSEEEIELVNYQSYEAMSNSTGSHIALQAVSGPLIYDIENENTYYSSENRHVFSDWFSDERELFGFYATGISLGDGASEYKLGVFPLDTKEWDIADTLTDQKTFKDARIIANESAIWITAGFDDGSFEYVLDLSNEDMVFMEETSEPGIGFTYHPHKDEFISLSGDTLSRYTTSGERIGTQQLVPFDYRTMLTPLPNGTTLYTRGQYTEQKSELVLLDESYTEHVLASAPSQYVLIDYDPIHELVYVATPAHIEFAKLDAGEGWELISVSE